MTYRRLLHAVAIGASVALQAGTASAVTFNGTGTVTTNIASNPAGPDLYIYPRDNQFDVNFDLAGAGDTYNATNLFTISAYHLNNTATDTIAVDFNFTAPPNGATGIITATAVGHTSFWNNYLQVTWADPLTLNFANDVSLQIQLGQVDTGSCTGFGRHRHCTHVTVLTNPQDIYGYNCFGGAVGGTFTYLDSSRSGAVAATPLPAGLPLFASGMGMFGGLGLWRKKRKARRATA